MSEKKILVIDDNEDILFTMRAALQLKLYDVYTWDRFLGVVQLAKLKPAVILLDYTLVSDDGAGVIKKIHAYESTKNIPVLIVSAWTGLKELAKQAGANDYLQKPFSLDELWKKTARYV